MFNVYLMLKATRKTPRHSPARTLVTIRVSSKQACEWLENRRAHESRYLVETSDSVNLPHVLARRSTNSLLCLISSAPLRPCIPTTIITTSVPCSPRLVVFRRRVVVFPGVMSRFFPSAMSRVSEGEISRVSYTDVCFPSTISRVSQGDVAGFSECDIAGFRLRCRGFPSTMLRVSECDVASFPGRYRGFPRAMSRVSEGDVIGGTAAEPAQQARGAVS